MQTTVLLITVDTYYTNVMSSVTHSEGDILVVIDSDDILYAKDMYSWLNIPSITSRESIYNYRSVRSVTSWYTVIDIESITSCHNDMLTVSLTSREAYGKRFINPTTTRTTVDVDVKHMNDSDIDIFFEERMVVMCNLLPTVIDSNPFLFGEIFKSQRRVSQSKQASMGVIDNFPSFKDMLKVTDFFQDESGDAKVITSITESFSRSIEAISYSLRSDKVDLNVLDSEVNKCRRLLSLPPLETAKNTPYVTVRSGSSALDFDRYSATLPISECSLESLPDNELCDIVHYINSMCKTNDCNQSLREVSKLALRQLARRKVKRTAINLLQVNEDYARVG